MGELDHTRKPAQQLGSGVEEPCQNCSSVGKYESSDKLLGISVVSYISDENEVKRGGNPIMSRK